MKQLLKTLALVGLFFIPNILPAQSELDTVYENLERKDTYAFSLSSGTSRLTGEKVYRADGEEIDEETYVHYKKGWQNMEDCCPCILSNYDINETLLEEGVYCQDCPVGWYKAYYPSGKLKISGQYKENPTGNWEDIYARGYCSVRIGEWRYYNRRGKLRYTEIWEEGELIEQISGK